MAFFEAIERILEPFTFIDGNIYYSAYTYLGPIECISLDVDVNRFGVKMVDHNSYHPVFHEVKFSTLGYEPLPDIWKCSRFCEDLRSRMRDKLSPYSFRQDFSAVEYYDWTEKHYFRVRKSPVEQKLKSW